MMMYKAQAAIITEKTRIPTTWTRLLPSGYFDMSSFVNLECAAVQESKIPAIISRHESVSEEIIV